MRWHAGAAWLPDGLALDVSIEERDGPFTAIEAATRPGPHHVRLPGVVLPGLANAHSHAFHRALRGHTHDEGGSFWTWRDRMFRLADRLDPDTYLALGRATFAEMALAGITAVGEFHYLHHGPGGRPYADPNAMGNALVQAAAEAGIRITLLDACYLAGGLGPGGHLPLGPVQRRFGDAGAEGWAERVGLIPPAPHLVAGAAIHSVRAVPAADFGAVIGAARGRPLHVHVSEQPAENDACLSFYGATPTVLLDEKGALGPWTTVVHATHVCSSDIDRLGQSGAAVCVCPTTERDLADGIGPARRLADRGVPICLGTDQHVAIDLLEEARSLEMDERLASGERGRFGIADLAEAAAGSGHQQLGWPDAGKLSPGARADLVAVRLDTPRTAGIRPEQAWLVAGAGDVDTVVVDGRTVVSGGSHVIGDVGRMLIDAITPLWVER
jgi:formiminoglutamate deiminase